MHHPLRAPVLLRHGVGGPASVELGEPAEVVDESGVAGVEAPVHRRGSQAGDLLVGHLVPVGVDGGGGRVEEPCRARFGGWWSKKPSGRREGVPRLVAGEEVAPRADDERGGRSKRSSTACTVAATGTCVGAWLGHSSGLPVIVASFLMWIRASSSSWSASASAART